MSSSVTLPASRCIGRQVCGRSAAAGLGAWLLRQLILHGGPVWLRPIRGHYVCLILFMLILNYFEYP